MEGKRRKFVVAALVAAAGALAVTAALVRGPGPDGAGAASHREAPLISLDGPADITDFFMFRSYEAGKSDRVVMIMDTQSEEPSSGPNYWNFDPGVVYSFNVDNDRDGRAGDIRFELRFRNEIRGFVDQFNLFLSYVGGAGPFPPITSLDGPGSEGIGLRQRYSVTMIKHGRRTKLADGLIAVPSNVGPRTMPSYEALAAQGVNQLDGGIRVFAGQRQDPFYIDLGGVFDTLNLRRPLPLLTPAEDAQDNVNPFGTDMLSGFNVHTIALEVPSTILTDTSGTSVLGAYAATARRNATVHRGFGSTYGIASRGDDDDDDDNGDDDDDDRGRFSQVQRLANPLINEAIIGTEDKDLWNALAPQDERRFEDYYLNPRLALALQLVYGVPAATTGRTDLRDLLLKYQPSDRKLSELLRLNLSVPPTPLAAQKRMTVLASPPDFAGWPNGRRPKDDVTDIAIRVVGGPNYIGGRAGDGVNVDDVPLPAAFPFLGTPSDGRNRQHDNP
jgi:hypothetical protein